MLSCQLKKDLQALIGAQNSNPRLSVFSPNTDCFPRATKALVVSQVERSEIKRRAQARPAGLLPTSNPSYIFPGEKAIPIMTDTVLFILLVSRIQTSTGPLTHGVIMISSYGESDDLTWINTGLKNKTDLAAMSALV